MAVTRIIPLHVGGRRSLLRALGDTINYVKNPEKTEGGDLVTAYQCNPSIAAAEFKSDYRMYQHRTGRKLDPKHSVIAYHLRQSFVPGEVTAEEANVIGRELAMRYTHGEHAFLVCTHTDRAHIHNHIIINAVNLDCTRKLDDVHCSGKVIGKLSDMICLEHGLSVLENAMCHGGKTYNKWQGYQPKPIIGKSRKTHIRTLLLNVAWNPSSTYYKVIKTAISPCVSGLMVSSGIRENCSGLNSISTRFTTLPN